MSDVEILRVLFSEFPYALWGSIVAAILCGYLGVYIISKRVVFLGATLTQVAVMGIAISHWLLPHTSSEIGSLVFTVLAVLFFARLLQSRNVPRDSVLGVSFVIAVALRILAIQMSPAAEVSEIEQILKGDLLFITEDQFILLLVVAVVLLATHVVFQKEFMFVSFDPETATAQGFNSVIWETFFYLTIGITISIATRIVGDVFVFGFLVIPAVNAILLAKRMRNIFLLAVTFALLPPVSGLYMAFRLDLPAGPTTVAVSGAILLLSWGWKRLIR